MILRVPIFGVFKRSGDHAKFSAEVSADTCCDAVVHELHTENELAFESIMWRQFYRFWLHRSGVFATAFAPCP
jgi:hypothetical protein